MLCCRGQTDFRRIGSAVKMQQVFETGRIQVLDLAEHSIGSPWIKASPFSQGRIARVAPGTLPRALQYIFARHTNVHLITPTILAYVSLVSLQVQFTKSRVITVLYSRYELRTNRALLRQPTNKQLCLRNAR